MITHPNRHNKPGGNPNPYQSYVNEIISVFRMRTSGTFIVIMAVVIMAILLPAMPAASQSLTITGRVADAGSPTDFLSGASVIVTDTNLGTSTNDVGFFSISIDTTRHQTLRIQYIGFKSKRIELAGELLQTGDAGTIYLKRDPFSFEDIIVTTSPAGRAANYQPSRAYNQDQLQRISSSSFGEMLNGEPGVSMRSFGSAPARPVIRGLDGDRVLIVENGERMGDLAETAADHAITLDPLAAERIEVVRGPASLLYGSSALGGVINIFNSDIPDSRATGLQGSAAMQGASVNNSLAGFGRLAFGTETGTAAARFNYRTSGDIRSPGGRISGTSNDHFSGSLGYSFSHGDHSQTGFSLSGLSSAYGLPDALDQPDELIEIRMSKYTGRGRGVYNTTGFFNQAEMRMNAAWYNHKEITLEFIPGGSFDELLELEFTSRSLNSTVLLKHGDKQSLLSGALGFNTGFREMSVGGIEALTPDMRSFTLAGLLFEEFRAAQSLSLQMGIRAEYQYIDAISNDSFGTPENATRTEWVTSGSVGLNWKPAPSIETGFQIGRAYRVPRLEELYSDAPHLGAGAYEIGNPGLKNEISVGTDLFVRYRSAALYLETAFFLNSISDFVIYMPTGDIHQESGLPVFRYDPADVRLYGGEISMAYRFRNVILRSGLDYVVGEQMSPIREPLPFMPPLRGNIGLEYETTGWFAGFNSRYVSRQDRVATGEDETAGYILLHLEGGIRMSADRRHSITFRIENALNTSYKDHLTRIEDRNKPMPGRGVTVTYRYMF